MYARNMKIFYLELFQYNNKNAVIDILNTFPIITKVKMLFLYIWVPCDDNILFSVGKLIKKLNVNLCTFTFKNDNLNIMNTRENNASDIGFTYLAEQLSAHFDKSQLMPDCFTYSQTITEDSQTDGLKSLHLEIDHAKYLTDAGLDKLGKAIFSIKTLQYFYLDIAGSDEITENCGNNIIDYNTTFSYYRDHRFSYHDKHNKLNWSNSLYFAMRTFNSWPIDNDVSRFIY